MAGRQKGTDLGHELGNIAPATGKPRWQFTQFALLVPCFKYIIYLILFQALLADQLMQRDSSTGKYTHTMQYARSRGGGKLTKVYEGANGANVGCIFCGVKGLDFQMQLASSDGIMHGWKLEVTFKDRSLRNHRGLSCKLQ